MKKITVFLSHSHLDIEKVRQLRNILEALGFEPLLFFLKCMDEQGELEEMIKREIDVRDVFLYCKSKNADESKWVQKELEYIKSMPYKRIYEIDLDEAFETGTVSFLTSLANMVLRNTVYILSDSSVAEQAKILKDFLSHRGFCSTILPPFDGVYPSLDKLQYWEFQKYKNWLDNYLVKYVSEYQLNKYAKNGIFIQVSSNGTGSSSWNRVAILKIISILKNDYGIDVLSLGIEVADCDTSDAKQGQPCISRTPSIDELNMILNYINNL